jgi:excisionase family DNA binding protein
MASAGTVSFSKDGHLDTASAVPATDRLLNSAEAAILLNVSKRLVEELARRGELPHVRIGRFIRFRRETLNRWIEEREQA